MGEGEPWLRGGGGEGGKRCVLYLHTNQERVRASTPLQ